MEGLPGTLPEVALKTQTGDGEVTEPWARLGIPPFKTKERKVGSAAAPHTISGPTAGSHGRGWGVGQLTVGARDAQGRGG
jgi:hypothetical protein